MKISTNNKTYVSFAMLYFSELLNLLFCVLLPVYCKTNLKNIFKSLKTMNNDKVGSLL